MAHAHSTRLTVRGGYIHQRLTLSEAARQAGVSHATARTWKRQAKLAGDNWDTARQAARLTEGGLGGITEQVLADFSKLFASTMADLRRAPAEPLEVAKAMATLSDAYAKMVRAAGCVDPQLANLGTALETIKNFAEFVKLHDPEILPRIAAQLEPFGAWLAKKWGK